MTDPQIIAALIGAAVGALLAGLLGMMGGLWASRREVLRNARIQVYTVMIQPMLYSIRAGEWDNNHRGISDLIRQSWLLTKKDRKLVMGANRLAMALEKETDAKEKDRLRTELDQALQVIQKRTAAKIR